MEVKEFFRALKKHCEKMEHRATNEPRYFAACEECEFREFCYTPPISLSDVLVEETQSRLEIIQQEVNRK